MEQEKICKLCKHKWISRKKNPVQCPRCKRYDWEEKESKKGGYEHLFK